MKSFFLLLIFSLVLNAQTHPNLILTNKDIAAVRNDWEKYQVFKKTFDVTKQKIDKVLAESIDVPVPIDAAGYTHERHSQNAVNMQIAGVLYQVTKDEKYALFVKVLLLKYAQLFPTLKKHPAAISESPGRLFWQSLNEHVWVVNTTQAYDCIYDYLSAVERKNIEENLFRKMAEYFLAEQTKVLNLVHNHGTWCSAAIGMIGMILNDRTLVDISLYGTDKTKGGGYLKQLDKLFSPDGFYTEGNYYVRYALKPFYIYACALNNYLPELKIFEYRNQILKKGFYTALQMTYTNGVFIPINDASKDKDYLSPEIVYVLDLANKIYGPDESLLEIASKQNSVALDESGLMIAKELAENKSLSNFSYKSGEYSDGANGDEGGVGILRYGKNDDQSLLMMKYTGHGLSHGHYDKLSILYYDNRKEILQDYGFARFVNVESKFGGRYLPENKSFALQTIAHNTVTVDERSNFEGKISNSEKYHSDKHFFSNSDPEMQIMSAKDIHAYKDLKMQRTVAIINDEHFLKPIIVDVFKVDSEKEHQYDLPFYYMGHFMETSIKYTAHDKERFVLGKANGYQHLWNEAEGKGNGKFQFTWLQQNRFYSISSNADSSTQIYFTRIGASDPNFNLRNESAIMFRYQGKSHVFASVIEPHGIFDNITEYCSGVDGLIEQINVIGSNNDATVLEIKGKNNLNWILMINNGNPSDSVSHSVEFDGKSYDWIGNYKLLKK